MDSGPTSRAVGRSKEEEEEEEEDDEMRFCRFPYLTLTGRSSGAGVLYG